MKILKNILNKLTLFCLACFPALLVTPTAASQEQSDRPIRVAVFSDDGSGTSRFNFMAALIKSERFDDFEIIQMSAESIREGGLKNVDVLVNPGGSGSKQARSLKEEGREEVRNFIGGGGGFLGICAGAYMATNQYSWSLNLIDAQVVSREHWARGTGMVDIKFTPAGQEFFNINQEMGEVYFGQGPLLAPNPEDDPLVPNFECLATYASEIAENGAPKGVMVGTSALVRSQFGNGRVLVFSAHPEKTDSLDYIIEGAVRWVANVDQ